MQTIWKYLEDLVGKGLELPVIFEFIFYFAIHLIPLALPLAILLSSIMVFGNLAERYELVAIKSAGVSLIRAMLPMFVISVIMAFAAFYTANKFIPKANLSWGALLYDVTQKKPAFNLEENVFFRSIAGYAIRVGKKHDDNETLEDILIYVLDRRHSGNNNILVAKKGRMHIDEDQQFMTLYLEDGKRYQEMVDDPKYKEKMPHNVMAFETYTLTIDMSELQLNRTDKERFSEDHRMLNVEELKSRVDSLDRYIENKKQSLYRYISPYFHEATDSLQIKEQDVDIRFEQLVKRAQESKRLPEIQGIDSTTVDSLVATTSKIIPLAKTLGKRKKEQQLVNERENILERAINNSNNVKRMSNNNISDTDLQEELKAKYEVEWHRKYTLAVSCILLFFIGAPLGAIIRKGGFGMPLVVSLLLFIVYYILNVFGEKLVREGQVDAWLGMWFSTFILFPLAIFLTYKASTDSRLLDGDSWNKFKRLFSSNANSSDI